MNSLNRVNRSMADLIHNTEQKTNLAYQMRDAIRLRSSEFRALAQVNEPEKREKILSKLVQATESYTDARQDLTILSANEREAEVLVNIVEAEQLSATAYEKAGERIFSMVSDKNALLSALGAVQLQELVLLHHLNDLVKLEKTLSTERLESNQARYKKMRQTLLAIVIAAFIVSVLISIIVINRVSRANRRIQHLASHDDLTGLQNRRSFDKALQRTIKAAQRTANVSGLLYIDFDRFKIVNDTSGHHAGDQFLVQLCAHMKEQLLAEDMFARVGGDEFAVIAQRSSFSAITKLAERLRVLVKEYGYFGQ